jgi:hypothetical protein
MKNDISISLRIAKGWRPEISRAAFSAATSDQQFFFHPALSIDHKRQKMPDKRKQGASTELDNTPASPKRVRRQVSYADLEDEDLGEVNRSHNTRDEDENEYEEEQGEEEVETKSDQPRQSPTRHPRSHPVYGQKSAFPGLDDLDDPGELFYGPAEDGLEYLRMVR